jgi:DNA polymerase III delta subunit
MLHVYFGKDTNAVRTKAFEAVTELTSHGVSIERVEVERYVAGTCAQMVNATTLFGTRTVYVLDTPTQDEIFYTEVAALLEQFADSEDSFFIVEAALTAPTKKVYQKHAQVFEEVETKAKDFFNVFSLAESLSCKDKKMLWVQLQEAYAAGLSSEEIIGTLWWQLKTLRVAALTKNAVEAGMKDYPYNKAKRAQSVFKKGEVISLSASLLAVYHDGHAGICDIDVALEQWILAL